MIKRINIKKIAVMLCVFMTISFVGCGKEYGPGELKKPVVTKEPNHTTPTNQPETPDVTGEPDIENNGNDVTPDSENNVTPTPDIENDVIHVNTSEELLEAIAPGVQIYIEPGYYNLSEYIEDILAGNDMLWNGGHNRKSFL